jgi:hypothetical protein
MQSDGPAHSAPMPAVPVHVPATHVPEEHSDPLLHDDPSTEAPPQEANGTPAKAPAIITLNRFTLGSPPLTDRG